MLEIERIAQEWGIFLAIVGWAFSYGILNNKVENLKALLKEFKDKDLANMDARVTAIEKVQSNVTNGITQVLSKLQDIIKSREEQHQEDKDYKTEMRENLKEVFNRFNTQEENIRKFYAANPTIKQAERKYP